MQILLLIVILHQEKIIRYVSEGGGLVNVNDGYGYVYPYISYNGNLEFIDPTTTSFPNMKPSFFVREYIDKIFLLAGFKIESKFFDTNYFKSLILPYTNGILGFTEQESEDLTVSYSENSEVYVVPSSPTFIQSFTEFDLVTSTLINDSQNQFNTSNNYFNI